MFRHGEPFLEVDVLDADVARSDCALCQHAVLVIWVEFLLGDVKVWIAEDFEPERHRALLRAMRRHIHGIHLRR